MSHNNHGEVRSPRPSPSRAQRLRRLDVDASLADPTRKQQYVTTLFDVVAPRYDRFTRLFSFGMDRRWKRELLERLIERIPANGRLLDAACGTGDFAVGTVRSRPMTHVLGLDVSRSMLQRARARFARGGVRGTVLGGDLTALPLPEGAVDAVSVGYGFRNVSDLRAALREVYRVLRPGGTVVVLDFFRPRVLPWRWVFLTYLRLAGGLVGWWWHRVPAAYAYIAHSLRRWMDADAFARVMQEEGFEVPVVRRRLLGGIGLVVGRKERE